MGHVRRRPDQPHPEPADRPMGGRRHHMDPLHRQRIPGRTPAAQHAADRTRRQAERRARHRHRQLRAKGIHEPAGSETKHPRTARHRPRRQPARRHRRLQQGAARQRVRGTHSTAEPAHGPAQPQQPTTPASDPWNATGAQTRQPAFTDGFAPAAPQQPAI